MFLIVSLLLLKGALAMNVGPQCGVANRGAGSPVDTRIFGGLETEVNEYPWQARLVSTIGFSTYICGGFLIDNRKVLTAAHCFFRPQPPHMKASSVVVSLGEHNVNPSNTSSVAVYDGLLMDSVRIHAGYTPGKHDHDIAIVYLQERVDWLLHPMIRPVCLPSALVTVDSYQGQVAVATGWGSTNLQGSLSDVLLEVNLRITPQQDCVNAYKGLSTPKHVTDRMVCAGPESGSGDTCKGDSGGPLVVLNVAHSQYEVIGITSWGEKCNLPQYPGVYTRVANYLEWIKEQDMTCSVSAPVSAVMQRRVRGAPATAFAKDWIHYEEGFSGNGELWLGLKDINRITSSGSFGLLVRMTDWDNQVYEAHYDSFQVGSAPDYRLSISGFNAGLSSLGDSMRMVNGMKFSTRDRDNDKVGHSCSVLNGGSGGWWFQGCGLCSLNGENSKIERPRGSNYIWWYRGGDRGDTYKPWADTKIVIVKK